MSSLEGTVPRKPLPPKHASDERGKLLLRAEVLLSEVMALVLVSVLVVVVVVVLVVVVVVVMMEAEAAAVMVVEVVYS